MKSFSYRDLTLTELPGGTLVTACDSTGGIGQKPGDAMLCPPFITGAYTVRVALAEVLCFGARVVAVTDAVCCEMEPTGREIVRGIQSELADAGLSSLPLNGSTEENMQTAMTAVGVTVVGWYDGRPCLKNVVAGDWALLYGKLKMGGEVVQGHDAEIFDYADIVRLRAMPGVRELVPVGSHGLAYEAGLLASLNGLGFTVDSGNVVDVKRSGGPGTGLLVAVAPAAAKALLTDRKAALVGTFRNL